VKAITKHRDLSFYKQYSLVIIFFLNSCLSSLWFCNKKTKEPLKQGLKTSNNHQLTDIIFVFVASIKWFSYNYLMIPQVLWSDYWELWDRISLLVITAYFVYIVFLLLYSGSSFFIMSINKQVA
jgi:hypothetical protein